MEQSIDLPNHRTAEVLSLLRPDLVFELTFLTREQVWRAFYKCKPFEPSGEAFQRGYRHEDGMTPENAIRHAAAACIARRLSDR